MAEARAAEEARAAAGGRARRPALPGRGASRPDDHTAGAPQLEVLRADGLARPGVGRRPGQMPDP